MIEELLIFDLSNEQQLLEKYQQFKELAHMVSRRIRGSGSPRVARKKKKYITIGTTKNNKIKKGINYPLPVT